VASDPEAEELVRRLLGRGYELRDVIEQKATDRLATARFWLRRPTGHDDAVDLLLASSGIEQEVVASAENIELRPGHRLPVALPGHLLALKILANDDERRPQDRLDIISLLRRSRAIDLDLARQSLALITERGFHRRQEPGRSARGVRSASPLTFRRLSR